MFKNHTARLIVHGTPTAPFDRMVDERMESTKQGIASPPESEEGERADEKRRERIGEQTREQRPDSAMGGTSDADSPADESFVDASRHTDDEDEARAERVRGTD